MRLKSLFLGLCLGIFTTVHAANIHTHPQATDSDTRVLAAKNQSTSFCGIDIYNHSTYSVHVSGVFDDNSRLGDFDIYPYEIPHFIDLFYYGYCHQAMYLKIQSNAYPYYILYEGQTYSGSTLRIHNSLANTAAKVETVRK